MNRPLKYFGQLSNIQQYEHYNIMKLYKVNMLLHSNSCNMLYLIVDFFS